MCEIIAEEMLIAFGLILIISIAAAYQSNNDSNNDQNSQHQWRTGLCESGDAQSPIDINLLITRIRDFPDLIFKYYDVLGTVIAGNDGDTEVVQGFTSWTRQPMITGGGLDGNYKLQQFHFHWDKTSSTGSEHTIDKLHYALEVHFVHVREDLTIEEAQNTPNGIAVLGVFFAIDDNQSQLKPFEDLFNFTTEVGSQSVITCRPSDLLPTNRDVWFRYMGSLTTPPCSETVVWTIFAEPIYVGETQLEELRHHISNTGGFLMQNRRPTQPLNGRHIYMRMKKKRNASIQRHIKWRLFLLLLILCLLC